MINISATIGSKNLELRISFISYPFSIQLKSYTAYLVTLIMEEMSLDYSCKIIEDKWKALKLSREKK